MKEITIRIPGEPKAVQSFKFTFSGRKYQPKGTVEWKTYIKIVAMQQLPEGWTPFNAYCGIDVSFVFPVLKSAKKHEVLHLANGGFIYKKTKPDLTDNLMKGVIDALKETVWTDDSIICTVSSRKVMGQSPRIVIRAFEIEKPELNNGEEQWMLSL